MHTVTISGGGNVQLFRVNSGIILTLRGLTFINGGGNSGGAISNSNGGTVNATASLFSGNNAPFGGGAIFNGGTANIVNSTFTGNSAPNGNGGAILNSGMANIVGSTFSGNAANGNGDLGGAIFNSGMLQLALSLVAGNSAPTGPDINGAVTTDGGGNVIGNTANSTGLTAMTDRLNVAPLLAPLGNYGGTTQTFAPLPNSPAIDITACPTNPLTTMPLATDARGISRPQVTTCDAGAVESRGFTLGSLTGNSQRAAVFTTFVNPLGLTVTSATGEPVSGGQVVFTITPGMGGANAAFSTTGGANCTLSAMNTVATCLIGATGIATAPPPVANGTLGTFTVTASARGAASVVFTLTVNPVLALPPGPPQSAGPGVPYSQTFTATGGTGTGFVYTVATGSSLPPGLMLNATTGTISGTTPLTPGSYTFTLNVTDSRGTIASRTYAIVIGVPNVLPQPAPTSAVTGMPMVAPPTHTPGAGIGVGIPTPLPQPGRH